MLFLRCVAANLVNIPIFEQVEGKNIVELFLDGNNLTKLIDYEFYNAGFVDVQKLSLRNNNIEVMGEKLFYKLDKLHTLYLSNNLISVLHPRQFTSLPNLSILDLSHNALSYLPSSTISSLMSSLSHLSVSGNNLRSLPSSLFPLLSNLSSLDLSYNPWTCNCLLADLHSRLYLANSIPIRTICSAPLVLMDQSWEELDTSAFLCKPEVSLQNLVISQEESTVRLSCNVTTSPGTEVNWVDRDYDRVIQHLSHPVPERDDYLHQSYSITHTELISTNYSTTILSVLSIHNVSNTSTGTYTCLAWNRVGMDQRFLTLKVFKGKESEEMYSKTVIVSVTVLATVILVVIIIVCLLIRWTRYKVYSVKGSNESMYHGAGKSQKSIMKPSDKTSVISGVKDIQTVSTRSLTERTVQQAEDSLMDCGNTPLHVCDRLQERERSRPIINEAIYPNQNIAETESFQSHPSYVSYAHHNRQYCDEYYKSHNNYLVHCSHSFLPNE